MAAEHVGNRASDSLNVDQAEGSLTRDGLMQDHKGRGNEKRRALHKLGM